MRSLVVFVLALCVLIIVQTSRGQIGLAPPPSGWWARPPGGWEVEHGNFLVGNN